MDTDRTAADPDTLLAWNPETALVAHSFPPVKGEHETQRGVGRQGEVVVFARDWAQHSDRTKGEEGIPDPGGSAHHSLNRRLPLTHWRRPASCPLLLADPVREDPLLAIHEPGVVSLLVTDRKCT